MWCKSGAVLHPGHTPHLIARATNPAGKSKPCEHRREMNAARSRKHGGAIPHRDTHKDTTLLNNTAETALLALPAAWKQWQARTMVSIFLRWRRTA